GGPIDAFHQAMLLQVPGSLREADLVAALQAVLDHHHALRLRLIVRPGDAEPVVEVMPCGTMQARACLRRVDIAALADVRAREACIAAEEKAVAQRLSPAQGVMVQAVWFDAGPETAGRLLLTIHHLVVDGVSWRILVPDLATAWTAIAADSVPVLPQRGTSFRSWSQRLWQAAHDDARVSELAFWRDMLNAPSLSPVAGLLDAKRDVA